MNRHVHTWLGLCNVLENVGGARLVPPIVDEPTTSAPLVLLDVSGMKCGGCSAAVKRMLAARPDVESAAVNLITETAAVRFRSVSTMIYLEIKPCGHA